jgi:uncharacterized protein
MKQKLINLAKKYLSNDDPSHDIHHALRVLKNAEIISEKEGGDLEIIWPAALFHDIVNYPKNSPKAKYSSRDSAVVTEKILRQLEFYPQEKISSVVKVIVEHSQSNGFKPSSLESKIIQDADRLECTGAIAIMRTFCSTGQMRKTFYHEIDPFCKKRMPDKNNYAIDLFYDRLLKISEGMNSLTSKQIAKSRMNFLLLFLEQLKREIIE